jgi:hypothetical protein
MGQRYDLLFISTFHTNTEVFPMIAGRVMSRGPVFRILMVLVAGCGWLGCSSAVEIMSASRVQNALVDGSSQEWQGGTTALEDEGFSVAVQNDADNLFLCVQAADRETGRRFIVGGMTVWFDRLQGTAQRWGIRFPLGMAGARRLDDRTGGPGMEGQTRPPQEGPGGPIRASLGELEIVGPGSDEVVRVPQLTAEREYGIQVAMSDKEGTLVYELKVPVATRLGRYAIGDVPGKLLGVEIETQKKRTQLSTPSQDLTSGGGLDGGAPSGGGRRGGGAGGRGGGGAPQQPPDQVGMSSSQGTSVLSLRVHLK